MKSHRKRKSYWQDAAQAKKVHPKPISMEFATMLDREEANRPERRWAIISRELLKYNIDIAALSEVRFPESGSIREESGYTIYWSGKPSGQRCEAGVALAVSNHLIPKLIQDPKPVNDRIMTLRLPLTNNRNCTLIATYTPTMMNWRQSKLSTANCTKF